MTTKALFVKLEAKPGKENEVAKFLRDGQGLVQQEPATIAWFGIRLGPNHLRHSSMHLRMMLDAKRTC
jgi:hypothetical protein